MPSPLIVFIHGRAQEFKDPAVLLRKWLAALNAGLIQADARLVGAGEVVFPFYGDVLYRITAESSGDRIRLESLDPGEAGPFHPDTPPDVGLVERQMLADLVRHSGIVVPAPAATSASVEPRSDRPVVHPEGLRDQVLGWRAARELLTMLAKRSRLDQLIIQAHLRDVAMYLTRGRDAILEVVGEGVPQGRPLVLVSHSLGTVVARDLLDDAGIRERTVLWVTTGSPLGLEAVQKNLLSSGPVHPTVPWLTAFDTNDVVALGHPLRGSWGEPLIDVEVENGNDPHSISRYLAHPEVASHIAEAMGRRD